LSRRQLLLVTEDPEGARVKGVKLWWWDLIFYSTFGLIVTSSVRVAGVLLVFAFLIIPAVAAMLSVKGISRRLLFGWLFGIAGCLGGLELSMRLDWSTGPTIVAVFLILLIGTWAAKAALPLT
jgi:zinc/manganese transport system permease protein